MMRPNIGAVLFLVCGIMIALVSSSEAETTVAGWTFELVDTVWCWVDDADEYWDVVPGRLAIWFNEGVTEAQRDTFAINHELTETAIRVCGELYTYDPERDPVQVLEDVYASSIVLDVDDLTP